MSWFPLRTVEEQWKRRSVDAPKISSRGSLGKAETLAARRKHDVAAHIARAVLEGNQEAAYKALAKALLKGNAYVFKELAERGYGKIKEN